MATFQEQPIRTLIANMLHSLHDYAPELAVLRILKGMVRVYLRNIKNTSNPETHRLGSDTLRYALR